MNEKSMSPKLLFLLTLTIAEAGTASAAEIVYSNTTTDTLGTLVFSTGPYSKIGDQIQLGGTNRNLEQASVQFFNLGSAGTFDATLRFFEIGAPVGTQIGSGFQLTNLSIGTSDILNVVFSNLNLLVPSNLIFTIEVGSLGVGVDLGLTTFDPPTVGVSLNTTAVFETGTGFSLLNVAAPDGNPYLELRAGEAVPEPATLLLTGVTLLGVLSWRRRYAVH